MKAKLIVDNEPRSYSEFMLPEMHLSSSRSSMNKHSFSIQVNADEVVETLANS